MSPNQLTTVAPVNKRDAQSAEAQPRMQVHSWRLIRTRTGSFHLVIAGDPSDAQGTVRVTSPISSVDRDRVVVTTLSGREYELIGPAEARELEREVLRSGAVTLGMGHAVDVSVLAWDLVGIN